MKGSELVTPSTTEPDLSPARSDLGPSSSAGRIVNDVSDESTRLTLRQRSLSVMTEESSTASPRLEPKTTPALSDKQAIRREQCRANQARYRNKQLNRKRELQQQNQRLEEEIQGLKIKRRSIQFERRTNQSPWTIIGEVFRLLEDGFQSPWRLASTEEMLKHTDTRKSLEFLQKSFVHDVTMGVLQGINSLMDQWRRYSLYFEEPHLELKRVETVTAGVVSAVATLSVTITEFTIRCVLPHLTAPKGGKGRAVINKKLLGQRIDCSCTMVFLFDEGNGRVIRIEPTIDWISPVLRLLGKLKDVSITLGQALVTSECILGELPEQ
ncbi:bZIP transcription factor 1 [Phytophthora citrophthora]|uniref:BZIP transcription factor 1 n=1 Tax=Phytophthora citrophthora TaxID=4793 RepID=A0AAD9GEL0_9STRA|nr:bZIP transcription factor 1 [Phytophthora citrophthora]